MKFKEFLENYAVDASIGVKIRIHGITFFASRLTDDWLQEDTWVLDKKVQNVSAVENRLMVRLED